MHIAIGYGWFPATTGNHLEGALRALGHTVTYVGLAAGARSGYENIPLPDIFATWPQPPDLYLWIDSARRYFPPGIEDLPIPTACYIIDVHLGHWREQVARFFDAVFIAQKDSVDAFRLAVNHEQVYWLPLAAAPDVHRHHDLSKIYEVGFVGNITFAHRTTPRARRLKLIRGRFRTNDFDCFCSPEEVGRVYSQSRIVFNTSIAGDVNMRVFEGAACGALVLTDSVANGLSELFNIEREIVTYHDDADCLNKIAYYLAHEVERAQIARAGYQRAHAQHMYNHRAQLILDVLAAPVFERLAPMRQANQNERWTARRKVYTHLHMLDALLDRTRLVGYNPFQRAWAIWPCLLRRLLL